MGAFALRGAAPRWWAALAVLVALTYLAYGGARDVTRLEGRTMGTTYRVVLGAPLRRAEADSLQAEIDRLLAEINASMSTYDPSSELSRFNAHASTALFPASPALLEVVGMAQAVSRASDGAFDVTVGPLVDAWGFGPKSPPKHALDDAEIAALKAHVGHALLGVEGSALVKAHPALRVDLSAIAKGYGVDRVAKLLEARGLNDHLVEIGGEVRARGMTRGRPFRVGIEEPDGGETRARMTLELHGRSLATSGNYRNFYDLDGRRYVHTIDPRSGRPAVSRLLSASVLHQECALADAWATALMVAGHARAAALAESAGLEVILLLGTEGGAIEEHLTLRGGATRVDSGALAAGSSDP